MINEDSAVESVLEFESGDVESETSFRNGNKKQVLRNGDVVTEFGNGNKRIEYKAGHVVTYFNGGDRESETIFASGVIRTKFRNGEMLSEDQLPDGSANIVMRDGTQVTIRTNGETTIIRPSGTFETRDRQGKLLDSGD